MQAPVIVGHSLAAVIATVYAAQHPTRGIVNVDQPLQVEAFAGLVKSLADKLRGPAFPAVWERFAASMHIELLRESAQRLVRTSSHPRQDLVLGYWREILERPVEELVDVAAGGLASLRAAGMPYLVVAGGDLDPDYERWLHRVPPRPPLSSGQEAAISRTSLTPSASLSALPPLRAGRSTL